ncbi:MAG: tRNA uridine-5-carboxymethylaminomethyl(34) synthesis enzyme MnmG [Clostridia bacterium]|nr:tRNA uridine-5-carboxymethylaminomethyl(34) synthesis enzyme MnmG [Clostridia bacterium]
MRQAAELLQDKKYYDAGHYDIAVVGAGHAGCEAALAGARLGCTVVLFTMSLDAVANLPCNPNIGGSAKGQLVREIAALGGEMPRIADKCGIQFRMLNRSKGPAVRAPRAQMDRRRYQIEMKHVLEKTPGLSLKQAEIVELLGYRAEGGRIVLDGVLSRTNAVYRTKRVILTTGTYLDSRIIIGETIFEGGPDNQFAAKGLADSMRDFGLPLQRFKTGTPVRVNGTSLDLSQMEVQEGDDEAWTFSYHYGADQAKEPRIEQMPCYITWTVEETHALVRVNLERSPLFSGVIEGVGPRYCPSFEDKVVKFPERSRHQLFIEPTGRDTEEMYVQGLSSSMPEEIQLQFLKTIPGLQNAKVQRTGYAIEYECLDPRCLQADLRVKELDGLFAAGQINGTSGYEEAAGQGILAGINAARSLHGQEHLILDRSQAYIGVLIDDLITEGTSEPYRMMSSRAEYRLLLRQDNADLRLSEIGHYVGLLSEVQYQAFTDRKSKLEAEIKRLKSAKLTPSPEANAFLLAKGSAAISNSTSLAEILKRPEIEYLDLREMDDAIETNDPMLAESVQNEIKYEGYIRMEERRIEKFRQMENRVLPETIAYKHISGLRLEARQKLDLIRPISVGQASRISGVSPADIAVLLVYLEGNKNHDIT